tara:strand:- start:3492 stop:3719 length:228 start_codon:yes stop_codon:yes gene_type:complete
MDVEEIISRPNGSVYSEEEMAAVVERYIKERKGVNVSVNIKKHLRPDMPFMDRFYGAQVSKLVDAFNISVAYLNK